MLIVKIGKFGRLRSKTNHQCPYNSWERVRAPTRQAGSSPFLGNHLISFLYLMLYIHVSFSLTRVSLGISNHLSLGFTCNFLTFKSSPVCLLLRTVLYRVSTPSLLLLQIRQCVLIAALCTAATATTAAAAAAATAAGATASLLAVLVQDGVYNFKSFQYI